VATADYAHAHLIQELSPDLISTSPGLMLAVVGVHTLGMLVVTAAVAVLVYEKFGPALLRQAWFNLDWLWSGALIVAAVVVLVL
jgi:hypothetical protein